MRGGRVGSLAASPTLVGAVTVLVVVVAVFLAYQANQGLPFVPTYKLSAELPDADSLVPGQRRADRRHPRRPDQVGRAGDRQRRSLPERPDPAVHRPGREGEHGAQPGPPAAARGLDRGRPGAVGARAQVPRDRPRQLQPGLRARLDDAADRRPARAGRDRPGLQHVRRPDPGRDPDEPARVRQRPRRARGGPERGDRPAQAAGPAARRR